MRTRTAVTATIACAGLGAAALPALAHQPATAAHAAVATHTVKFGEYFYRPKKLTINAGDRVRFTNIGKIEHTVADSTKSGKALSKIIKPRPLGHGASQTVTFKRRGTVPYLCTFHPDMMRGVIVVR
jgi:plastocyanin